MKILQVHNIFIGKTGEETVLEEERIVLEENGHRVVQFLKDNSALGLTGVFAKARLFSSLRNSETIAKELEKLIKKEKPDICHVHNTFPIVTPVVYRICNEMNVPVVKTLHNYKMVCTNSLMFREGSVCEKCLNKSFYNSVRYKCYRDSYLATAIQANVLQHHRNSGTWSRRVDAFFCLTDFQKDLLTSGGLPASKLYVKPNFIKRDNSTVTYDDFFLFVGKVGDYKGLQDLLYLFDRNIRSKFVVIGKTDNQDIFNEFNNVDYLGEQGRDVVLDHMKRCRAVIFPSLYYEGMPMVILEAFSNSKAVVSRNQGAMSSMIIENYNGLKYEDVDKLIELVERLDADKALSMKLGENAYLDYQDKYTEEKGYENLMKLYSLVIDKKQN